MTGIYGEQGVNALSQNGEAFHGDGNFGKLDIPDVETYEVRGIWKPGHKLYITQRDKEKKKLDRPFVLVFEKPPFFNMRGWIYGVEGIKKEWFGTPYEDRPPAWWVPQIFLKPMEELPGIKTEDVWCEVCTLTPAMCELNLCELMKLRQCPKLKV